MMSSSVVSPFRFSIENMSDLHYSVEGSEWMVHVRISGFEVIILGEGRTNPFSVSRVSGWVGGYGNEGVSK